MYTDGSAALKAFPKAHDLEHHIVCASRKGFVKDQVYHIQHVNSLHSQLKPWINDKFHGVSTKFLQNYMNWFRLKTKIKESAQKLRVMLYRSLSDVRAWLTFLNREKKYELWITIHTILD